VAAAVVAWGSMTACAEVDQVVILWWNPARAMVKALA
jgi:hypothetical protein